MFLFEGRESGFNFDGANGAEATMADGIYSAVRVEPMSKLAGHLSLNCRVREFSVAESRKLHMGKYSRAPKNALGWRLR